MGAESTWEQERQVNGLKSRVEHFQCSLKESVCSPVGNREPLVLCCFWFCFFVKDLLSNRMLIKSPVHNGLKDAGAMKI